LARPGLPLKLTPALIEDVAAALSQGLTRETAAKYVRISYQSFYSWYVRGKREAQRIERGEPATAQQIKSEAIFLEFFNQIEQAEIEAVAGWQQTINTAIKAGDVGSAWRMLQLRDPKSYSPKPEGEEESKESPVLPSLPADVIAPAFLNAYRDIRNHRHTEYLFYGGRGSTKSSFVSLAIVYLIANNPTWHALALRQVADTLRTSVYGQIVWAIETLGLSDKFKTTSSPMEITYIPTGQKIYFRGLDDPMKIKSIKPQFGSISILWFEELPEFHGDEAIRSVTQSAIRGTNTAYIFKSFNPPRTSGNWVNKYRLIPKESQYQHKSDYRDVPIEWLGKVFVDEAEFLQTVNAPAFEHEYLGEVNGIGDMIFENVELRTITDQEIAEFDNILHGLDFGYFPHPAHYARVHYNASKHTLYIIGEVRRWKSSNEDMYKAIVEYGYNNSELLICDSEDPKSIADYQAYGAHARGAEKGNGSVKYSMKWVQSLAKIVIDPARAPYTAEEFTDYAYLRTKDGEIIEEYPREKDDAIASVRYSTNLQWRKRGQ
jgi:phage terminase large subunit